MGDGSLPDEEGPILTDERIGQALLKTIGAILVRVKEAERRLGYPGEGTERPFRGWLVSDLLFGLLKWPQESIVVGERFDILLRDPDGFPVITIETKKPFRKASKKEHADFQKRLEGYGTLRAAYFTNGASWERLDIFSPGGTLQIQGRATLQLKTATPEETEAFFVPLISAWQVEGSAERGRNQVTKTNPHILESLAADLHRLVGQLAGFYERVFETYKQGRLGTTVRDITLSLFDRWCRMSLLVSPNQATAAVKDAFAKAANRPRELARILRDLGFPLQQAIPVADQLATLSKGARADTSEIREAVWPLYADAIRKLCPQTAHLVLGRLLLYRIGEDQGVFPRQLSGQPLQDILAVKRDPTAPDVFPMLTTLSSLRQGMTNFLPSLYQLGEFDWWLVPEDKRAVLNATERTILRDFDLEYERCLAMTLRVLDAYVFRDIDVDVWRNIYQHYLPPSERQRLGGFYTPDELVDLILDTAQYFPEREELCKKRLVDPASGSGAFVTAAVTRLLAHLKSDLSCHADINRPGLPDWKRAEAVLNTVTGMVHAIDIHPFAAFLTTLNVTFLLLPIYIRVREKNQDVPLELQVLAADSLEMPDVERRQQDWLEQLNSRIQLSEAALRRYYDLMRREQFDYIFGNPPWGGILKGPLAPVFDEGQKRRFKQSFPAAAQGKYDIYGLFIERGLQILRPGGRLGLVTQGSFLDKEWASGLRRALATAAEVLAIIDLNPFGNVFFGRMNTPAIMICDNRPSGDGDFLAILSSRPRDLKQVPKQQRRVWVVAKVREAIAQASRMGHPATVEFASACRIPRARLLETAATRWDLSYQERPRLTVQPSWPSVADLLEPFQGVTPGGQGGLEVFLMSRDDARKRGLEEELTRRVCKGIDVERWRLRPVSNVILYPYVVTKGTARRAFAIDRPGRLADALDFETPLDAYERRLLQRYRRLPTDALKQLVDHRTAQGLITFPKTAGYLAEHYEFLERREFKKRNIREFNRWWYEYIWPRSQQIMLARVKIITPRLVTNVRFALDSAGTTPQDSCIVLLPSRKTAARFDTLKQALSQVLNEEPDLRTVLKYILAFVNSSWAQELLVTGRRPTPKGFYQIDENYLRDVPIVPPKEKVSTRRILTAVETLTRGSEPKHRANVQEDLNRQVRKLISQTFRAPFSSSPCRKSSL